MRINKRFWMKEVRKNSILSLAQESKDDTLVSFTPSSSFGERAQSCLGNKVALAFFGKIYSFLSDSGRKIIWSPQYGNLYGQAKNNTSCMPDKVPPMASKIMQQILLSLRVLKIITNFDLLPGYDRYSGDNLT